MRALEKKHGISTPEFLDRFRSGKIDHNNERDWVRWVGLSDMAERVALSRNSGGV